MIETLPDWAEGDNRNETPWRSLSNNGGVHSLIAVLFMANSSRILPVPQTCPPPPPPPGEGLILGYLLKCFIGVLPVFVALNHFARAFRGLNNITACMHASMHLSIHPSIHPSCCQFLEAWVLNMIYGLPKNVIILTATNQHTMHVHAL